MIRPLSTAQTELVPLNDSHFEGFFRGISKKSVAERTITVPHPFVEKQARYWFDYYLASNNEGNGYHWAIMLKGTFDFAGVISLFQCPLFKDKTEIGIWIAEDYWHQGIGRETLSRITRYAEEDLKLSSLVATHISDNFAIAHLFHELGFIPIQGNEIYSNARKRWLTRVVQFWKTNENRSRF